MNPIMNRLHIKDQVVIDYTKERGYFVGYEMIADDGTSDFELRQIGFKTLMDAMEKANLISVNNACSTKITLRAQAKSFSARI